ncbi:MAG: methyltransferase domain-containing protein [Sedimentisphaerales bacterium]|nr:methyltransferase domain-containing protein [Sedimentisphaerales bacterium]
MTIMQPLQTKIVSKRMDRQVTVECIDSDISYSNSCRELIHSAHALVSMPFVWSLKTLICYDLFHATEKILTRDEDPVPDFISIVEDSTNLLKSAAFRMEPFSQIDPQTFESLEQETGSHYGNLFNKFDEEHYFHESLRLLRTRLERNQFDFSFMKGKRALDAGCGAGRYAFALRNLGFEEVIGLDCSVEGISHAQETAKSFPRKGVSFTQGSVLDIPFDDASFDFVFSNGVLHHTRDMERGVEELLRVLKPGGKGFLYLIESPGGIFWDCIEVLRALMRDVPYEVARQQFALMGVPSHRCFYILDHIMVPINIRSRPEQVEQMLREAGAVSIRRLRRGTDFDRIERIHWQTPFCDIKYGVGENRYFFEKS